MSGFTRQWLQLRETADHRARSRLSDALRGKQADYWEIVDLGCGTGSNLRYLASAIGARRQRWTCIDNDANLLESLVARGAPNRDCSVATVHADLARDLAATLGTALSNSQRNPNRLIAASALLDLVSAPWIDALVNACARQRVAALFALTYDGRIELSPEHPQDRELQTLVNAHQLNDKGFGPALGPGASDYARSAFAQCGYAVMEAPSDWHLDSADRKLQRDLLAGWVSAARDQSRDPHRLAQWHTYRQAQIDSGELTVLVGHRDLLALPADSA